MDVELSDAPPISYDDQSALYCYLQHVSNDSKTATLVYQILIEEIRSAHCTQWNSQQAATSSNAGKVAKSHVHIQ